MTDPETGDTHPKGCGWPECDTCTKIACNSHPDRTESTDDIETIEMEDET